MENYQTRADEHLASARLMVYAASLGLDWVISYEDADGESKTFRLVRDGMKLIEPRQVIGATEEDARDCISLTATNEQTEAAP